MQKVVSISLNGNSYQLEEPGYEQLRAYLERADSRLKDSPDRAEVMADLEQAISEKCRATLSPHKTVVNTVEVERIISEMGPVESPDGKTADAGAEGATASSGASQGFTPPPRKRLYQIREGAMLSGVCNGIAAYLNVDVTWVRLAFVLLTIFTGVWIVVYLVMMCIVPVAYTAEDRAAAFGMPFNTEELISRAKKNFESFGHQYRWRREWRRQQRHWNRQFRHMNEQLRVATANAAPIASGAGRVISGVLVPIAAIVNAVIFVAFILAIFSLVTQHSIFGWDLPHHMPWWVGIVGLALAYSVIASVLRIARHSSHPGSYHPGWGALYGLLWLGSTVLLFWAAYTFFPGVHELVDQLMWAANLTATTISETIV